MNKRLTVGLIFYPEYKKEINLTRIRERASSKSEWKIEKSLEELDILLSSEFEDVRIRKDGVIFYYKEFKGRHINLKELKSMWNKVISLVHDTGLDIKYANEINLSLHVKESEKVYHENIHSIKEFGKTRLNNFSIKATSGKTSTLITISPSLETIQFDTSE